MPKISDREKLLTDLERFIKFSNVQDMIEDDDWPEEEEGSSSDDDMDSKCLAHCMHLSVAQQRFLNGRQQQPRSRDYILNYFLDQSPSDFRTITRVTRETFEYILSLIQEDPVFQNQSRNPQHPVHWQLACALDRLGNDGQGVSIARSKTIWGIGQGTIHLYTRRVVKAICNLKSSFIRWPGVEARNAVGMRMAGKGFKNVVGFVDGTTIPLHKKPAVHGNVFMDRKKRYSVNAQIVCDDKYTIIYFMTGQAGSVGDSRVFSSSKLASRPDLAFSPGEYLLADSGYAAKTYVVPAYKDNQRDDRTDEDEPRKIERFNTFLAKARVINEHCIGVLKSRWTSMRGARIDIHEPHHMRNFVEQATACVVLHNICTSRDPWDDEWREVEDHAADRDVEGDRAIQRSGLTPGQKKRWVVRNACLAFHSGAVLSDDEDDIP